MTSPTGAFIQSAPVFGGTAIAPYTPLVQDPASGFFLPATAANRALYGRTRAMSLSAYGSAAPGVVSIQGTGPVDNGLNLGAGAADRCVRASATGTFEVFTPSSGGSSDIVGWADANGQLTLDLGAWTETRAVGGSGGGATPAGNDGNIQVKIGTALAALASSAANAGKFLCSLSADTWGFSTLTALQINGTTLNIGQDNAGGTQFSAVQVFPSTSVLLGVGATPYLNLSGLLVTAQKPIACGTGTVATQGDIRLSSTGIIAFDRGGFNILGLYMDTGTSLAVGSANATNVTINSGIDINIVPAATANVLVGGPVIGRATAWGSVNGIGPQAMADANQTPAAAVYQYTGIKTTGALTANRDLTLPTATDAQGYQKWINNTCTGAFSVNVRCAAGTQVLVANGKSAFVWIDSRGVTRMTADV